MKKTIVLLIAAIGLGIFTYFFEEQRGIKKIQEEKHARALFNQEKLGNFRGVEFPNTLIKKVDERFYTFKKDQPDIPVDPVDGQKLQMVLDQIGHIQVKRVLNFDEVKDVKEEEFFPWKDNKFTFIFEKGSVPVLIGRKVEHDQTFYVRINTPEGPKMVLAYDASPQETPLPEEDYRLNPFKYNRIVNLVHLGESFYLDTFVLRNWKTRHTHKDFKKVRLTNVRNRPLEVDFSAKKTIPAPPLGVAYLDQSYDDFSRAIFNIQAGKIWKKNEIKQLKEKTAEVQLSTDKETFHFELFRKCIDQKGKVLSGQFLKVSGEDAVFEISGLSAKLLFTSGQDFLEKRIFKNMGADAITLEGNKEETFDIRFAEGEEAKLVIPKGEDFQVLPIQTTSKIRPLNASFSQLFSFLFGPGERVSMMDKDDQLLLKKTFLTLERNGVPIHLVYQDREILVLNPKSGIKINYYVGTEVPFGMLPGDYFDLRAGKLK